MTDRCRKTVKGVVGEAWSDAEIDDVLERLQRAKARAKEADPLGFDGDAFDAAAREITKEEVTAALMERRLHAFAARARVKRRAQIDTMLAEGVGDEADALRAFDVGTEKQVTGGADSVDAEGRARSVSLWTQVEKALGAHPGLRERLVSRIRGRADPEFERKVAREMARANGADIPATGDKDAVLAGRIFADAIEAGRVMQNREGAWIGKIDGYIGRQSHDRLRVAGGFWRELEAGGFGAVADWNAARLKASKAAFREWRDFIRPKLADETFDGVDLDVDEATALFAQGVIDRTDDAREVFLYQVWSDITTGRHEVLEGMSDLGEYRPPAGKARSVSANRVLHFVDPDAWMDYAEAYSRGGLYGALMGDLDRAGRNSALMSRWGPSPEAARAAEIERLSSRARRRGDTGAIDKLNNRMRQAEFEELNGAGQAPENLRLAIVGRSIRAMEVLSKLGGIVLSALSDGSFAAQRMKRAGGTYLDGYGGLLGGVARLQGEERKAVADALDVGARSAAAHLTARFAASDGPLGWFSWAQRTFFKVSGFEFWMDGAREGLAATLSNVWGRQADRAWSALEAGTREDLQRFGLDEKSWDLLRGGAQTLSDGRRYLTTDAVDLADADGLLAWSGMTGEGAVEASREALRLRMQTMVQSVLDDTLTEARARERVGLTRGLKPGTVGGEAMRLFTQFWSFSQAVLGRHIAPALRGYAGQSPVALMAHLIVASTALGYLSLQMKQLVKGRELRSLENDDGENLMGSLFIASLLQGGGLGIYGDFLFGEANRNGMPATLSSFAGPAVGDGEKLFAIVMKAAWGDPDDKADAGGDFAKFAITSLPGANLWYTRWALDYLVLYRMQEAMSPGYLERFERRVEDREGAGFLLPPSEVIGN